MSEDAQVITSSKQIVEFYRNVNYNGDLMIGIEWERSGVYGKSLYPVRYYGPNGYLAVLQKLVEEAGWEIIDGDMDQISELKRGNTRITLEGDGRLELAGSPDMLLHNLAREFRLHVNEVKEMGDMFDIKWIPLGIQPFHSKDEIKQLDKKRYDIFVEIAENEYMGDYMKKNNGIHVNFSYLDEENAIKKSQTLLRVSPIICAMFASSPLNNGKLSGYLNYRRFVNDQFARLRTGIPDNILEEDFSLEKWIEFYLDVPLILIIRDGKEHLPKNMTFRKWMEKGYNGDFPTLSDFDQHIKTTWSDLRIRQGYLEYRAVDSVPFDMFMSVPAFVKGLLFHSDCWEQVYEMTKDWDYDFIRELDERCWKKGLQTDVNGKKVMHYAQELLLLSNEKLHEFARMNQMDEDEAIFLQPIKEQIFIKEKSMAEEIASKWESEWNEDPRRLIEYCESSQE